MGCSASQGPSQAPRSDSRPSRGAGFAIVFAGAGALARFQSPSGRCSGGLGWGGARRMSRNSHRSASCRPSALSLVWNTNPVTPDGPSPTYDHLLEQQVFLRRLARSLVTDAHRAEDLAQDATLAALERAPANATSLRAWLARVLRNRAVNVGLAEERRRAREQAAPRPAPPRSPDELEAHFQVQRRVMEAVDRLDEPYRTAILLRYYRDLAPSAIAEQLGVPLATVKSRLARALARLREQLDEGETRGSHAWVAVLAGGLGELHRPAAATALAAGGIAMGVKLALGTAAACGALALGTWWLSKHDSAPAETPIASETLAEVPQTVPAEQELALHTPQVEAV